AGQGILAVVRLQQELSAPPASPRVGATASLRSSVCPWRGRTGGVERRNANGVRPGTPSRPARRPAFWGRGVRGRAHPGAGGGARGWVGGDRIGRSAVVASTRRRRDRLSEPGVSPGRRRW